MKLCKLQCYIVFSSLAKITYFTNIYILKFYFTFSYSFVVSVGGISCMLPQSLVADVLTIELPGRSYWAPIGTWWSTAMDGTEHRKTSRAHRSQSGVSSRTFRLTDQNAVWYKCRCRTPSTCQGHCGRQPSKRLNPPVQSFRSFPCSNRHPFL